MFVDGRYGLSMNAAWMTAPGKEALIWKRPAVAFKPDSMTVDKRHTKPPYEWLELRVRAGRFPHSPIRATVKPGEEITNLGIVKPSELIEVLGRNISLGQARFGVTLSGEVLEESP